MVMNYKSQLMTVNNGHELGISVHNLCWWSWTTNNSWWQFIMVMILKVQFMTDRPTDGPTCAHIELISQLKTKQKLFNFNYWGIGQYLLLFRCTEKVQHPLAFIIRKYCCLPSWKTSLSCLSQGLLMLEKIFVEFLIVHFILLGDTVKN